MVVVVMYSICYKISHRSLLPKPRSPSQLDVIIVRKEGATGSHKNFRVRRSVVLRTLQWLIEHNFYYSNVTIDHSVLALLRIDGDLTILPTMSQII